MNYALHLLVYLDIYVMLALGVNLVSGYCGMLSLGHAAFFAIGGYAYALAASNGSLAFPGALLAAAVVGAALSPLLSLPGWRLKGDLFALATVAVGLTAAGAMTNWNDLDAPVGSWRNLTNGPYGLSGIPHPSLGAWVARTPISFALVATTVAGVAAWASWRLQRSPWGRVLVAMRDDELAARGLGKHTGILKLQAFAVSCALTATAGALYASYAGFLEPGSASFDDSLLILSMVFLGGSGNFAGPVAGASVIVIVPELLRLVGLPDSVAANLRLALYGVSLVVLMHVRPQGLLGRYRVA